MADELRDMRLNGDRQIEVGGDGDIRLTDGLRTVEQSVAIHAGDVLRPLVGEPLEEEVYFDIEAELEDVLQSDPQIDNVQSVEIESVNIDNGTVTINVFTEYNNSFQIEPQV